MMSRAGGPLARRAPHAPPVVKGAFDVPGRLPALMIPRCSPFVESVYNRRSRFGWFRIDRIPVIAVYNRLANGCAARI